MAATKKGSARVNEQSPNVITKSTGVNITQPEVFDQVLPNMGGGYVA